MEDPFILKLSKPVMLDKEYDELTLTEPTAGQVEKASGVANAQTSNIVLLASVTGLPETVIRKIAQSDFQKAVEYLENFIKGGQATGETSSPN